MGYLTIETVREELQDRTPADNTIDCDYAFTDEEILHAMERAAASYNRIPPVGVEWVSPKCLPDNDNVFLDAVLSHLYKAQINRLSRNLMTWKTGDTTVEFEKTRMGAYQALRSELEQSWREAAKGRKMEINRALVWGSY